MSVGYFRFGGVGMRNFHENVAAGAALPRNVQFPDISVEEIGFLEQFRATGYLWLRLLGSAGTPLPRLATGVGWLFQIWGRQNEEFS